MGGRLTPEPLQQLVRAEWWRAVATVTRLTGDLELAEEAVQDAGVVAANRAVAVGMAHGPAAGLALADELAERPELRRWAPLHMARADLLRRLGRTGEAAEAYLEAARLDPPPAERELIMRRLAAL